MNVFMYAHPERKITPEWERVQNKIDALDHAHARMNMEQIKETLRRAGMPKRGVESTFVVVLVGQN